MRAGGLHSRTIEVFDQRGIAEQLLHSRRGVQQRRRQRRSTLRQRAGRRVPERHDPPPAVGRLTLRNQQHGSDARDGVVNALSRQVGEALYPRGDRSQRRIDIPHRVRRDDVARVLYRLGCGRCGRRCTVSTACNGEDDQYRRQGSDNSSRFAREELGRTRRHQRRRRRRSRSACSGPRRHLDDRVAGAVGGAHAARRRGLRSQLLVVGRWLDRATGVPPSSSTPDSPTATTRSAARSSAPTVPDEATGASR